MQTCSVYPLPYRSNPADYFAAIRHAPGSVLLDSGRPSAERGRYDLLSAWPLATLAVAPEESGAAFLQLCWNATSLEAVQHEIATHGASEPFAHLTAHAMHAQAHHARYGAAKLEEAGSAQEFLTRTIKKVLDEETMRMESGLSVLATIGATAPFVGLFGTVWGVYHALLAIGATGAGTLDKVAGPVGEALIMTALGLAVAIPAVLGYNALVRGNKSILGGLNSFAHDLHAYFVTGARVNAGGEQAKVLPIKKGN